MGFLFVISYKYEFLYVLNFYKEDGKNENLIMYNCFFNVIEKKTKRKMGNGRCKFRFIYIYVRVFWVII